MPHLPTLRARYSAAGGTFLTLVVFRDPVAHTVSTYRYMGTSKRRKPALSQWVREKGEESSSVYRAPSWGLQVAANLEVQRHTTRPTLHRSCCAQVGHLKHLVDVCLDTNQTQAWVGEAARKRRVRSSTLRLTPALRAPHRSARRAAHPARADLRRLAAAGKREGSEPLTG